jgi:hypothetical protein
MRDCQHRGTHSPGLWELAVRTTSDTHIEFGTATTLVYQSTDTGQTGVFPAFRDMLDTVYIKLVRLNDNGIAQAQAVYQLVDTLTSSMHDTILNCGVTTSFSQSASTTQWTSAYSGTRVPSFGELTLADSGSPVDYVFICGINEENDKDHSILAFTDHQGGVGNGWSDSWRGPAQIGTIWSMYNDDYLPDRGFGSNQGYPGIVPRFVCSSPHLFIYCARTLNVDYVVLSCALPHVTCALVLHLCVFAMSHLMCVLQCNTAVLYVT